MRCHYIKYKGESVLIPECMGTAAHSDISFCSCPKYSKQDKIKQLEERIEKLEYFLTSKGKTP